MFSAMRIHYSWYGQTESYLLITIDTLGAAPELWRHWLQQDKKGNLMNDELMEKVVRKDNSAATPKLVSNAETAKEAKDKQEGKVNLPM